MTFDDSVHWIRDSSDPSIPPHRHRNQLDWFTDRWGRIRVDFIGRFECLESDWALVAERLGIRTILPHANQTPTRNRAYHDYYSPQTRDIIARKFRVDIEYFGYEFGCDSRSTPTLHAVRRFAA